MKPYIAALLCCLLLLSVVTASACGTYILIPDSDTRLLFEEEVRSYHYESLGYVLNEILARHGYHFNPEGKYYDHFNDIDYVEVHDTSFPYREAPAEVSNEEIIASLSNIELKNISLIKKIQKEKREKGDESGFYADWSCHETPEELYFSGVGYPTRIDLPINLKMPVYSGPGEHYLRGAKGRAMVTSDEEIDAYGFDGDWLMVVYLVDPQTKQTRVGYIHKDEFGRELNHAACHEYGHCHTHYDPINPLEFINTPVTLAQDVSLTDDPTGAQTPLTDLKAGETLTLLLDFPDEGDIHWAYVEYAADTPVRGFVPADTLSGMPAAL